MFENEKNNDPQEQLEKISREIQGNQMKILDDFCKAHLAAESYMTGKELMTIISRFTLNMQTFSEGVNIGVRYWFSLNEKE